MKEQLKKAVNIESSGLDDFTLKKLLLSYYRTCYLTDTEIYIELDGSEMGQRGLNLVKAYRANDSKAKDEEKKKIQALAVPYTIVNKDGNDFGTAMEKWYNDTFNGGIDDGLKMGGFYLKANGIVKIHTPIDIKDENNRETACMQCYTLEGLEAMYKNEYEQNPNSNYAKSVRDFLKCCYAFDDGKIKVYAFGEETTKKTIKYSNNDGTYKELVRNVDEPETKKGYGDLVVLDYNTNITKYTTPVEFFVDLMEIAESRNFIDAVIEMLNRESIDLQLYELEDEEKTVEDDTYNRITTVTGKKYTLNQVFDITYTPGSNGTTDTSNKQSVDIESKYIVKGEDILKDNPNAEGINKDYYYIKDFNKLITSIPESIKNNNGNQYDFCEVRIGYYNKKLDKNAPGNGKMLEVYEGNNAIKLVKHTGNQWIPDNSYGQIKYVKTVNGMGYFEMNTSYEGEISGKEVAQIYDKRDDNNCENLTFTDEDKSAKEVTTTTKTTKQSKYEIAINEVNVWHGQMKVTGNSTTSETTKYTEDEKGNLKEISKAEEKIVLNKNKEMDAETYTPNDKYTKCTWHPYHEHYMNINEYDIVESKHYGNVQDKTKRTVDCEAGYVNSIFNYLINDERESINKGETDGLDYTWNEIKIQKTYTQHSLYKEKTETIFVQGTETYTDTTDRFLSLLSNEDGKYEIGKQRNFKSKKDGGKVVRYPDLYDGKSGVGELLENGADMLFELLESKESTEPLTNLMKYIMYRYSGNDYGVTSFNFVTFDISAFSTVSGESALSEFIKAWENGDMRNYINGTITNYRSSPFIYNYITEDKKYYYARPDSGNTWDNNRNFGFGVCFFYGGNKWNNVEGFEKEGVSEQRLKSFKEGDKLEVEIVDRIKETELQNWRNEVVEIAKGKGVKLEDYQIDALTACMYQWGYMADIGGFLDVYKRDGLKESIREACPAMKKNSPYASRNEANWKLFSTGKYTDASGNEIVVLSSFGSGGSIVECAIKIHKYMETEKYVYSLNTNELATTFEESKKYKRTCCATYVTWVLKEAGVFAQNEGGHNTGAVGRTLEAKGWVRIVDVNKLEPGDILFYAPTEEGAYARHVDIYAGNGQICNAGSTDAIQRANPYNMYNTPDWALRAPNKK